MSDPWTKLAYFMPTGTFLTFQTLAPLTTYVPCPGGNDTLTAPSDACPCGTLQYVLTGVFLGIMALCCFLMSFTDSMVDASGKTRYGFVTNKGLRWRGGTYQLFEDPPAAPPSTSAGSNATGGSTTREDRYQLRLKDWAHALISVLTFVALSLLTPPVSTCFFRSLPPNILLAVPVLIGSLASAMFNFIGEPRKGVGFPGQDLKSAAEAVQQRNPQIVIKVDKVTVPPDDSR